MQSQAYEHRRYLDCLINVVKVSFNDGIMPRNPFASYRYNEPTPERAFLNEEEILTLQHAALRTKKQRMIRDLFLFSCFTGICYADLKTLAWKQLEQDTHGDWWVTATAARRTHGTWSNCCLLPCPFWNVTGTARIMSFLLCRI